MIDEESDDTTCIIEPLCLGFTLLSSRCQYLCNICAGVDGDIRTHSCRALVCQNCLASRKKCKTCHKELHPSDLSITADIIINSINNLEIKCNNCEAYILYSTFEMHLLKDCSVKCPYGCEEKYKRQNYKEHYFKCSEAIKRCTQHKTGCGYKGSGIEYLEHIGTCQFKFLSVAIEKLNLVERNISETLNRDIVDSTSLKLASILNDIKTHLQSPLAINNINQLITSINSKLDDNIHKVEHDIHTLHNALNTIHTLLKEISEKGTDARVSKDEEFKKLMQQLLSALIDKIGKMEIDTKTAFKTLTIQFDNVSKQQPLSTSERNTPPLNENSQVSFIIDELYRKIENLIASKIDTLIIKNEALIKEQFDELKFCIIKNTSLLEDNKTEIENLKNILIVQDEYDPINVEDAQYEPGYGIIFCIYYYLL